MARRTSTPKIKWLAFVRRLAGVRFDDSAVHTVKRNIVTYVEQH